MTSTSGPRAGSGKGGRRFLVLMGAPGAGKGTQATRLAAALGLCKISTGDLLRDAIRAGTEIGRAAESTMRAGALVADDVILDLVRRELETASCAGGAVFDGFPRTPPQAEGLERLLGERGERLQRALFIDVDEDEIVRRLSSRRICDRCGRISDPAAGDARAPQDCTTCGGTLVQRPDDRPETVRRRLEVFREQTAPLLDRYRAGGLLRRADGSGDVETVFERVRQEVE